MIEADVNEFKTLKHIFDPKCEHDGGFNKSNDADWCYRWDSTFIEIRDLRSSEVMASLPIEALLDHNNNKIFTQVAVILSGNKYLLVVCVEDNNENTELYIFDPLVKTIVKVGNTFKAKITNLKVSDSFHIDEEESPDYMFHFIIMSTSTNEIVSDLLKLPRKVRNNSVILEKNSWSFYQVNGDYGKISALETCVEENQPILFAGFAKGKIVSYYLVVDKELNTSLEMNKEYTTTDVLSSVCSIIYRNKKLFVTSGSYTEYDYSRNIAVSLLNLTEETTQTIDFPETPGKIEVAALSPNELYLYIVYIHKAKTVLKVVSMEIMREISDLDITQTYFTPATTAVSLRILGLNTYSNGICCDVLYLTKYVGYTDDDYSQISSLKIPRVALPNELKSAPSLYTDEQRKQINIVRKRMSDSKLFIDLLLDTMEIETKYPFNTYDDLENVQNILFKDDAYNLTGHCIIYYILKDLNCNYEEYAKQWSILPHYLIAINGYWALDHQNIKEAFNYLWNPLIEIDWPEKIIQLLYDQKYYNEACRFIQITKTSITSDIGIELQMKLYLKTNILDAFLFQRKYNYFKRKDGSNLFSLFLKHCFEEELPNSSLINKIRKFPYNKNEETQLIEYMRQSNQKLCKDFLLMYYIYHGKYIEAIRLHEENKLNGLMVTDIHQDEREALIQNIKLLLPKVQRSVLEIENEKKKGSKVLPVALTSKRMFTEPESDDAMEIDEGNTETRLNSFYKPNQNLGPLSASKYIHQSKEHDQKVLLRALKNHLLVNNDNTEVENDESTEYNNNKNQPVPFALPPTIPEKNTFTYEMNSNDGSLSNLELNHYTYTNSILNNLSPFSLKQSKEIKENNKQTSLISKQANENTQSSKMYSNALKRVVDEDDDEDDDSINYHNDVLDQPMEIKKIDGYDGRIKKLYSSSGGGETNKTKSTASTTNFYSTPSTDYFEENNNKSVSVNTMNETFYTPSYSEQKSSRKTLKILSN